MQRKRNGSGRAKRSNIFDKFNEEKKEKSAARRPGKRGDKPFPKKDSYNDKPSYKKTDREEKGGTEENTFSRKSRSSESRPFKRRNEEGGNTTRSRSSFKRNEGSSESRPYKRRSEEGGDNTRGRSSFKRNEGSSESRPYKRRSEEGGDNTRGRSSFKRNEGSSESRPYKRRSEEGGDNTRSRSSFKRNEGSSEDRPYKRRSEEGGDNTRSRSSFKRNEDSSESRPYKKRSEENDKGDYRRSSDNKTGERNSFEREKRNDNFSRKRNQDTESGDKFYTKSTGASEKNRARKEKTDDIEENNFDEFNEEKTSARKDKKIGSIARDDIAQHYAQKPKRPRTSSAQSSAPSDALIRLNKYIANAGICSRREADKLIESGAVTVNGKIISELGYKVNTTDIVAYGGTPIKREKNVYVLLNKPKDYITTLDDPEGRKTVMELVKNAGRERIFPVGRLDRNTTGLLLLTNDGIMAAKLTHPKYEVRKVYHVLLNSNLKKEDMHKLLEGIELEDGLIKVDDIEYANDGENKKEIGVELHSGKNRIVRRMFEHLGYEVIKLDRIIFAGLTKKDLQRGRWRFLTEKEVNFLKML